MSEPPLKSYRRESKIDWGRKQNEPLSDAQLTLGCMLRIADVLERLADKFAPVVPIYEERPASPYREWDQLVRLNAYGLLHRIDGVPRALRTGVRGACRRACWEYAKPSYHKSQKSPTDEDKSELAAWAESVDLATVDWKRCTSKSKTRDFLLAKYHGGGE